MEEIVEKTGPSVIIFLYIYIGIRFLREITTTSTTAATETRIYTLRKRVIAPRENIYKKKNLQFVLLSLLLFYFARAFRIEIKKINK